MSEPRSVDEAIDELEFQREINQQLGAENAAMRPIVEWMGQAFISYGPGRPGDTSIYRLIPKVLIEQARAFLASESAGGDDE